MPRYHRRKTNRWINEDYMQSAVADVCGGLETPSTAARKYGLKRTTIIYRVERKQKMDSLELEKMKAPQPLLSEIFSAKQEKELMDFLNRYTYLPYDTSSSYKAARQLVYQFVKSHDIKRPKMWDIEQQAGVDWLMGFIERNPQTNLRNPIKQITDGVDDEDEVSVKDGVDETLPETQKIETETDASPHAKLPVDSIRSNASVKPKLESDISHPYSFAHFMDDHAQEQKNHIKPDPCEESSQHSDPETDSFDHSIMIPVVSIKQESETNTEVHARTKTSMSESTAELPKLDTVPADDDVFNSFGRNIAFQVKELYRLSRLDAYELMYEVQTAVNRCLTDKLRLMKNDESRESRDRSLLSPPRVIKIDDDDEL